jgi:hypothetical protein
MPKARSTIDAAAAARDGFSVIEALLATTILAVMAGVLTLGAVDALRTATDAGIRRQARWHAEEGLVVVRTLRDKDGFGTLSPGSYHALLQGGAWTLEPGADDDGIFIRKIDLTVDGSTITVQSTVGWDGGREEALTAHFTDWRTPVAPPPEEPPPEP